MNLYEAAKDLHDYLLANVPDTIDISTGSQIAGHGITTRLQHLRDALKQVSVTDMPLSLMAGELRDIANDLSESDENAWKGRISMLRDIAGDMEGRSEKSEQCREDGRCQYAIDHGAEGLGHCPDGQCSMPTRHLGPIDGNHANTALENWFPFSAEELKRARPDGMEFAAKICDGLANNMTHGDGPEHHADAARQCAREIRARIRRVP